MTASSQKTALTALHSLKIEVPDAPASTILVDSENFLTPPSAANIAKQRRLARWTLMIGVSDLLNLKASREGKPYPERSAYCLRLKVPNKTPLLMHTAAGDSTKAKARYKNMRTCGSVWACPVCGSRIGEVRRGELSQGLETATGRGWNIFMLTFTLQHEGSQPLRDVLVMLKSAYADFRNGKAWEKLAARLAIEGTVQGKEATHGANGWHPHLHVLCFSSLPEFPAAEASDWLKKRWQRMVIKYGGYATYDNGLLLTLSTDVKLAEYPAKMGLGDLDIDAGADFEFKRAWSIAAELAKSNMKEGRASGRTPLQLVAAAMVGDERAGDLWLEYFDAMKGQRQLWWSQGLREKLGLGAELPDEAIAESPLPEELEMLVLTDEILTALSRHERGMNARGVLLEVAASGSIEACWEFLTGIGVERPSDEITYRVMHVDLDTFEITDRGEISAAAAAERAAHNEWFFNTAAGGSNE